MNLGAMEQWSEKDNEQSSSLRAPRLMSFGYKEK